MWFFTWNIISNPGIALDRQHKTCLAQPLG